jgi:hypothetical protein
MMVMQTEEEVAGEPQSAGVKSRWGEGSGFCEEPTGVLVAFLRAFFFGQGIDCRNFLGVGVFPARVGWDFP